MFARVVDKFHIRSSRPLRVPLFPLPHNNLTNSKISKEMAKAAHGIDRKSNPPFIFISPMQDRIAPAAPTKYEPQPRPMESRRIFVVTTRTTVAAQMAMITVSASTLLFM